MRLKPTEDLTPGGKYTVSLNATQVPGVGGMSFELTHEMSFQVACSDDNAGDCPDTGTAPAARLDGAEDYQSEWTEQTTWEADGSGEGGGCASTSVGLPSVLLMMALGCMRRRRARLGQA